MNREVRAESRKTESAKLKTGSLRISVGLINAESD